MLRRYLGAIGSAAAAVLLRWALAPVLGRNYTFVLAYPTTVVVTRLFGIGPGIVAVLAAGAGMAALTDDRGPARLGVYLALSGLAVFVTGAWDGARAQAIENASRRAREEQVSAQLRAIVESSEDAIISTDLDGYIQSWNRAAEAIFGFTAAEAVDHPLSLLLPPTRPDQETEVVERVRRGVHVKHFETVRVRKDGRTDPGLPDHLSHLQPFREPHRRLPHRPRHHRAQGVRRAVAPNPETGEPGRARRGAGA